MTRRFTTRTAGIFAALLLASCIGDSTGPGERRAGMISIAPDFNIRGINSVDVNRVLIRFTKPNSTVTVYDTIVPFPATTDTLDLSIHLAISGASEQFLMTILMIDDPAADTVFQSGPTLITAVAGVTPPVPTPAVFTYVGVGSHAAGVRFLATPSQVLNGDTVLFAAEAFDSSGATIPNTPIVWTSSDTVRAKVPADSIGRIIGGVGRGNVTITAALLTPPTVTSPLLVQPKPAAILVQGGSGQTGTVGLPLSQPVSVQVRASDNLGVQGVVVNFAVTGGGTLSQLADTTDVNGNASTAWTLGGTAGAQSVGVTVGGVAGTTSVPATGVAGAVKKLAFQTVPASVVSGQQMTPPVTVAAQDTFGNLVTSFTGAVTVAIGANPAGGTLSGTTTVAAAAGVATFSNLSIDNIGASYSFVATATGLVSATSGGLAVTAPFGANAWINPAGGNWSTATNWSKGTVPSATDTVLIHQTGTYTVNLDVSQAVASLDLGATTGLQTLSIAANTLTMNGNGTVTANGKILMTGGTITGPGVVDVFGGLDWQGGSLSGGGGTLRVRTGGTLSISGATARTLNAYTLESGGGGAWSGTGVVNSGGGGTVRVVSGATLDISGDPQFLFSQGGAASRLAVQAGATLRRITSTNPALVTALLDDSGSVLVNTGTLQANGGGTSSGAFTVASGATLSFGGGTQTLQAGSTVSGAGTVDFPGGTTNAGGGWTITGITRVNGGTANFNGAAMTTAALDVTAGNLGGGVGGLLTASGAMTWSGGGLTGAGGTVRVLSSGSLAISGTTARQVNGYTLEQASAAGTWTGIVTVNSGAGGTVRVLPGGSLDIQGDPTFSFNQGGAASLFENQGTLLRSTSAGSAQLALAFTNSGTTTVSSGTLALSGGGTLSGTMNANGTGILSMASGTFSMANNLAFGGTGALQLNGATLGGLSAGDTVRATVSAFTLNTGFLSPGTGGTVKVTGSLNWAGSATLGGTGKTLTTGAGGINMSGAAARSLTGQTLEIGGAGANLWTGAFTLSSGSGAVLRVLAGTSFSIQSASSYLFNQGGTPSLLDNLGSLTFAPGASATFTASATFNNTGNVIVSSGTASLGGGGLETGAVNVGSGAFLDYAGGTHTLNNGVVFSGAGTARLQAGTITNATTADSARFVNLQLNGGTVSQVGGMLVVGGTLDWAGSAAITGTGTVAGNNVVTFTGTAGRTLQGGIFENRGNATWTGAFAMSSGGGAILRNAAGRSFVISADASYQYNLGGAKSVFQNLGTLNSAAPTLMTVSASFNTTSTLNITAGTLRLSGDAQLGGAVAFSAAANVLDIPSGTDTLKTGLTVTGAGFVTVSGGTLTADSGATFSIPNLQLSSGNLAHEAVVQASATFGWAGGTISSNTVGLGGTTRVLSGAVASINNAGGISLTGTHILDIVSGATANYTGAGTISTGGGATIQNAGSFNWQGAGNISFNLGGAQSVFRQTAGTLLRNTAAGTVNLGAQMFWSGGTIQVATGVLQLSGGSGASFAGNATVTSANGLDLSGGAFTMSNNVLVTGDLLVSGSTLTPNGHALSVTGNFTTSGGGGLPMTNAADSVDINGNASFGGSLQTMNAGVIRLAGNFVQTGVSTFQGTAQSAAVAHRVVLDGASGTQNISFANTTNNFFRRLWVSKGAGSGVVLLTNVRTTYVAQTNGTTGFTGSAGPPITVLIADTIAGIGGGSNMTSPLVIQLNQINRDSGNINVDTVIYAGSGQSITTVGAAGGSISFKSIRVAQTAGTATMNTGTITLPNDLEVSSGTLNLNATHVGVTGNFRTTGSGVLQMASANDSLGVAGNVSFGGGSTAGTMTAGLIEVKGSFSQSGATNSFAPSTAHRTRFNLPGSAVIQQVSFANPTTSFFDSLDLNRGPGTRGTVNFQTDARINRGLSIQNSTDVKGPTARISIVGGSLTASQSTTSPTDSTLALELAVTPPALANMVGAVSISPDTMVINTGITTMPTASGLRYNSIRINTGASVTMPADTIAKDLDVASGTASFPGTYFINGKLRTRNTGLIAMPVGGAPNVTVVDSAVFGGASTSGQLVNGTLRLRGTFNQQLGPSNASFQATAGHTTVFEGTGTQTVFFASNGVAASTFGNLFIGRTVAGSSAPAGITIQTPINVAGTIQDSSTNGAANDSIVSNGQVVTAIGGISTGSQFVFNRTTLVLNNYTTFNTSGLSFNNMNPASTYLSLTRNAAGSHSVTGLNFNTPVTAGTGKFINLQTGANLYTFTAIAPGTPSPSGMTGNYVRSANATLVWIGSTNP